MKWRETKNEPPPEDVEVWAVWRHTGTSWLYGVAVYSPTDDYEWLVVTLDDCRSCYDPAYWAPIVPPEQACGGEG